MTVRELIMALLLNSNLDDTVTAEVKHTDKDRQVRYVRGEVKSVFGMYGSAKETILEAIDHENNI